MCTQFQVTNVCIKYQYYDWINKSIQVSSTNPSGCHCIYSAWRCLRFSASQNNWSKRLELPASCSKCFLFILGLNVHSISFNSNDCYYKCQKVRTPQCKRSKTEYLAYLMLQFTEMALWVVNRKSLPELIRPFQLLCIFTRSQTTSLSTLIQQAIIQSL